MADSINLDLGYFDHIKTVRLASMLGRGAEMLPVKLWCYCGMHPNDNGTLTDFSADDVETVILRWWGVKGKAVEAMVKVGFLDFDGTTYKAHGWSEKNGHITAFHNRAVHAAQVRWHGINAKTCLSNATSNATSIPKQCPTDLPTNLPTVLPTKPTPRAVRPVFHPPSQEEIREFVRENSYTVVPEEFHSYYESNGWKVGRNQMKDWKATVRTWHFKNKGGSHANINCGGFNNRPNGSAPREDGSKFRGIGTVIEV